MQELSDATAEVLGKTKIVQQEVDASRKALDETKKEVDESNRRTEELNKEIDRLRDENRDLESKRKESSDKLSELEKVHMELLDKKYSASFSNPTAEDAMNLPPCPAARAGGDRPDSGCSAVAVVSIEGNVHLVKSDFGYCVFEHLGESPGTTRIRRAIISGPEPRSVTLKTIPFRLSAPYSVFCDRDQPFIEDPDHLFAVKEAFILGYVKHPNIINLNKVSILISVPPWEGDAIRSGLVANLIGSMVQSVFPCLVMEMPFMEFDLAYALRMGRVLPKDTEVLAEQLLRAVTYLHSIGVAHRAISPLSILVSVSPENELHFTLTSFSCAITPAGEPINPKDSPDYPPISRYSSPDVLACIRGRRKILPKQWFMLDIWAVGSILLEVLSGKGPVFAPSVLHWLGEVCRRKFEGVPLKPERKQMQLCPILICLTGEMTFSGIENWYINRPGGTESTLSYSQRSLVKNVIEPSLSVAFEKRPFAEIILRRVTTAPITEDVAAPLPGRVLSVPYLSAFINREVPRIW